MEKYAWQASYYIWKHEGIRGFFKGLPIGLVQTPIATAVSLTVNDLVKKRLGWQS